MSMNSLASSGSMDVGAFALPLWLGRFGPAVRIQSNLNQSNLNQSNLKWYAIRKFVSSYTIPFRYSKVDLLCLSYGATLARGYRSPIVGAVLREYRGRS